MSFSNFNFQKIMKTNKSFKYKLIKLRRQFSLSIHDYQIFNYINLLNLSLSAKINTMKRCVVSLELVRAFFGQADLELDSSRNGPR